MSDQHQETGSGKQFLAVSTVSYRGIPVLETNDYYVIFLGKDKFAFCKYEVGSLAALKTMIDDYLLTKRN